MQKKKRSGLLQNTITLLAGSTAGAVLSFILTLVLARLLTPDLFGGYVEVLAWLFPAMLIAEFGFGTLLVRELSAQPLQARGFMIHLLPLRLFLSMVCAVGFVSIVLTKPTPVAVEHALAAAPMIFIFALFTMLSAAFRARYRMGYVAVLNVGMLACQVVLLLLGGLMNLSVTGALAINTLTSLGQLMVAAFLFWRMTLDDTQKRAPFSVRVWLRMCLPFAVASTLGAVQARLLIMLLDARVSSRELAYLTVALRFLDVGRLAPMAFFDAMFARLSAQRDDPQALRTSVRRVLNLTLIYAGGATVVLFSASSTLISTLFGSEYRPAVMLLMQLAAVFFPMTLHAALNLICYATGREWLANVLTFGIISAMTAASVLRPADTVTLIQIQAMLELTAVAILFVVVLKPLSGKHKRETIPASTTDPYIRAEL